MADHDDLRRTIGALREDVPMRPEWRSAVLRDLSALPRPRARRLDAVATAQRVWTLRPRAAIAACLLCAAIGGAITLGVEKYARERSEPLRFVLVAPAASRVAIVGDFNGWSPTATPLRRTPAGLWSVDLPLSAGRHTYAFVVDGVLVADPNALDSADDDFGVPSSVVLVSEPKRT